MSTYDEDRASIIKVGKKYGDKLVPARLAIDTQSAFEHAVGIYVDDVRVAWIPKEQALRIATQIEALPLGSSIAAYVRIWNYPGSSRPYSGNTCWAYVKITQK